MNQLGWEMNTEHQPVGLVNEPRVDLQHSFNPWTAAEYQGCNTQSVSALSDDTLDEIQSQAECL